METAESSGSGPITKPYILHESYPFLLVCAVLFGGFLYAEYPEAAIVPLVLGLYFAYFFRCPKRKIPYDEDLLLSPADGTVMDVADDVDEDLFLGEKCHRVTIFLSVFNVHTNRAPMAGKISFMSYIEGRFRPAYESSVGYENERGAMGITGKKRSILVVQIAGLLARRVVLWRNLGEDIKQGELYGMIKFGSCTELYVPGNMEIYVKKGDKVIGGTTIIGRLTE